MATLASWNVDGLRPATAAGVVDYVRARRPAVMCLNEIMCTRERCEALLADLVGGDEGYGLLVNPCVSPGPRYHGVAMLYDTTQVVLDKPFGVQYGLATDEPEGVRQILDTAPATWRRGHTMEGRVLCARFLNPEDTATEEERAESGETRRPAHGRLHPAPLPPRGLVVLATYVPNSGVGGYGKKPLARLEYRTAAWDASVAHLLASLRTAGEHVVWLGDLNVVADKALDHWDPKARRYAGNTREEREGLARALEAGDMCDTFRSRHGASDPPRFSFFSKRARGARESNKGWRLDYVMASRALQPTVSDAFIDCEVAGSDHVPVGVTLECGSRFADVPLGGEAGATAAGGAGGGSGAPC